LFYKDALFSPLLDNFDFLYLISNLSNYLWLVTILVIFIHFKIVDKKYFFFWALYFSSPFFLNFVLFDPIYWGDQFLYTKEMNYMKAEGIRLRDFDFSSFAGLKQARVEASLLLLSFFFIPSYLTVTSLAFANKLIVFLLFVFLSRRIEVKKLFFFFLIPSLILWSSLSLREILVLGASTVSIIYLIERRLILSLFFILLVVLSKVQNSPGFLAMWVMLFILRANTSNAMLIISTLFGALAVLLFFDQIEHYINLYRLAFAQEDGMRIAYTDPELFRINSGFHLIYMTLAELPFFMLKPFPWQATNPLQIILFLESVILLYLLVSIIVNNQLLKERTALIFIIGFLICMGVHAITTFNFGTLSRYRFIAFFPFLIGFYYMAQIKQNLSLKT